MKPRQFAPWAEQVIGQSPAVASVTGVTGDDVPYMSRVEMATGAQIYIQWVATSPPSGQAPPGEPDPVVAGPPPEPVKVAELPSRGRLRTVDIERHLAALLNNGAHEEVAEVTGYTAIPDREHAEQRFGIRIRCHSDGMLYGLFRHTLPRGQQPGPGTEFKQREEV